jgi:hypothetical protein
VALTIAGKDQRRRDLERKEDQDLADFRVAVLLQAPLITIQGLSQHLCGLLTKAYDAGRPLYFVSGTRHGIPDDVEPIDVLGLREFGAVGHMDSIAAGVSKSLGAPVLAAVSWSRQIALMLEMALIDMPDEMREQEVWQCIVPEVMPGIITQLRFLNGYLELAKAAMDDTVGSAISLPASLIHPDTPGALR